MTFLTSPEKSLHCGEKQAGGAKEKRTRGVSGAISPPDREGAAVTRRPGSAFPSVRWRQDAEAKQNTRLRFLLGSRFAGPGKKNNAVVSAVEKCRENGSFVQNNSYSCYYIDYLILFVIIIIYLLFSGSQTKGSGRENPFSAKKRQERERRHL